MDEVRVGAASSPRACQACSGVWVLFRVTWSTESEQEVLERREMILPSCFFFFLPSCF